MKKILIVLILLGLCTCIYCFIDKEDSVSYSDVKNSVEIEEVNYEAMPNETINLSKSVSITKEGVYTFNGNLEGSITVDTKESVKIILDNVNIKNNGPCILVKNVGNITIYLNENSTNYLTSSSYDTTLYNATIYSKDDIVIEGNGSLIIDAYEDAIASTNGLKIVSGTFDITSNDEAIRGNDSVYIIDGVFNINTNTDGIKTNNETDDSKGNIVIENGTFNIKSNNDAIQSSNNIYILNGKFNIKTGGGSENSSSSSNWGNWNNISTNNESSKGIKAVNNIVIDDGIYTLDTSDDSIHSNSNIDIKSGDFNITSFDDGIHADTSLIIDGGNINITKSYEGLEASIITINNGTINVTSTDDGINVAGGNDSSSFNRPGANNFNNFSNTLTINNGVIKVNATGDGIDVNGKATITGGSIYVEGPTNSGNGFFDYDGSFVVTNATLIGSGSTGMLQIPTCEDLNAVMIYFDNSSNQNKTIVIKQNDKEIISYSSSKSYNGLYIASPLLKTNNTYDIYIDGEKLDSFTIFSSFTKVGNSISSMGNMGGFDKGNPRR